MGRAGSRRAHQSHTATLRGLFHVAAPGTPGRAGGSRYERVLILGTTRTREPGRVDGLPPRAVRGRYERARTRIGRRVNERVCWACWSISRAPTSDRRAACQGRTGEEGGRASPGVVEPEARLAHQPGGQRGGPGRRRGRGALRHRRTLGHTSLVSGAFRTKVSAARSQTAPEPSINLAIRHPTRSSHEIAIDGDCTRYDYANEGPITCHQARR